MFEQLFTHVCFVFQNRDQAQLVPAATKLQTVQDLITVFKISES